MAEIQTIMKELEALGSENTRRIYRNHGAGDPLFGVSVGNLKILLKKLRKERPQSLHETALELYKTGNSDARYLAGLMADPRRMTREDLNSWAEGADWYMLSEYTVAGVTAESPWGHELSRKWMESDSEMIASAGWAAYADRLQLLPDGELDLDEIRERLNFVRQNIHRAPNRVRYAMNNFVITAGTAVAPLTEAAVETAEAVGEVEVFMGKTSCEVPYAPDYIRKVKDMNRIGRKKKTVIC